MEARTLPAAPDTAELDAREERELFELLKQATLGEYDIYALLGRGGMAAVFRAMDLSLNRWVAIKVISPSALSSATVIDRFWLEARTAASLSHPNIIPIFAVRAVGGLHFFVMKHVQGGALDVVLKNEGPMPFAVVRTILSQVAGALAYAHRRGVVHRDIKPANIMLDEEGYAIVMDFGIAKVRDVAALTASGAMVGTPYYMSPEQFNGELVDGRSDQYSLGCVAYELLTGVRAFKGDTVPAVLRAHLLDKAPDVRKLRPDCPTSLATVVNRMLSRAPTDRFASMDVLCGQLDAMPRMNSDAMRDRITSLARTASQSNPQISEPMSPVPLSRTSAEGEISKPSVSSSHPASFASASKFVRRRPLIFATALAFGVMTVFVVSRQLLSDGGAQKDGSSQPVSSTIRKTARSNSASATILSSMAPASSDSLPHEEAAVSAEARQGQQGRSRMPDIGVVTKHVPVQSALKENSRSVAQRDSLPRELPKSAIKNLVVEPSHNAPVLLGGTSSFTPAIAEPAPAVPRMPPAFRIGSRIPAAFLYVDGHQIGLIRGLNTFTHPAGPVHIQIRADDCLTWDSVLTVTEGDTAQIGFRNPVCGK